MIRTELREHGGNGGLYGPSRARAMRHLREEARKLGYLLEEESGVGVKAHRDKYEKAADDAPATLARKVHRALSVRGNNTELERELSDLLDKHLGSTDENEVEDTDGADEDESDNDQGAARLRRSQEGRVVGRRYSGRQAICDSLQWEGDRFSGGRVRR